MTNPSQNDDLTAEDATILTAAVLLGLLGITLLVGSTLIAPIALAIIYQNYWFLSLSVAFGTGKLMARWFSKIAEGPTITRLRAQAEARSAARQARRSKPAPATKP